MKFFKQIIPNTCNIIAIQHGLSFFGKYPSFEEIEKELPKHSFGNFPQEIGIYLSKIGVKTTLISNCDYSNGKNFAEKLKKYKKLENFEDRAPTEEDVKDRPVIVNVDVLKIREEKGAPIPHYVVLVREGKDLYMYDGVNFNSKVKRSFEDILKASVDINEFCEDGMWLVIG
jgi:hypothetical protein